MKSCHIGPVFLLRCVSHIVLKSLSDLIFGSQIAQFHFLPFVDNVCSEEWVRVAGSCGITVGCDRPARPGSCEDVRCGRARLSIGNLRARSPGCFPERLPRARACFSFGEMKMNKVRATLGTEGLVLEKRGHPAHVAAHQGVKAWKWSRGRPAVGGLVCGEASLRARLCRLELMAFLAV